MREVICVACQELKPYYAKGKCERCYAHGQYKLDYKKNREKYLLRAKQYREENPDYHHEYNKKYYQEHRDELIGSSTQWNRDNPEKRKVIKHRYYEGHKEEYYAYARAWKRANPEKARESRRRFYQRNKEKLRAASLQWARDNPERVRANKRRYQEENRERIAEHRRRYREEHREEIRNYNREWCRKNPGKVAAQHARRLARKQALPDILTGEQAKQILSIGLCFYCGRDTELTLDHFVPIGTEFNKACGTTKANSVVACRSCNSSKGNKLPTEIISQLTLLS